MTIWVTPGAAQNLTVGDDVGGDHIAYLFAPYMWEADRGEGAYRDHVGVGGVGIGGQQYGYIAYSEGIGPNPGPTSCTLERFREILEDNSEFLGTLLITTHGNTDVLAVESYEYSDTGLQDRDDALNAYLAAGYTNDEIFGTESSGQSSYCIAVTDQFITRVAHDLTQGLVYVGACQGGTMTDDFVAANARVAVGNGDSPNSGQQNTRVTTFFERMDGKHGQANRTVANAMAGLTLTPSGATNTTLAPSVVSHSIPCPLKEGDIVSFTFDTRCNEGITPNIMGIGCTIGNEQWLGGGSILQGECTSPPAPGANDFTVSVKWDNVYSDRNVARMDGNTSPGGTNAEGPAHDNYDIEESCAGQLDVIFIMDVTGSTGDLLPQWQSHMPSAIAAIQTVFPGSRFGLVSHLDYPFHPYGDTGEWAFRMESPLVANTSSLLAALSSLSNGWGNDNPESQYEAIYQTITGEGRDLTGDGDYNDVGEIFPTDMGYMPGNNIIIFHFTWPAMFHDWDSNHNYPYSGAQPVAGRTATIAALLSKPVIYFGLVTSKEGDYISPQTGEEMNDYALDQGRDQMQELADLTGGAVLNVGYDLSGLDEAIAEALDVINPSVSISPNPMYAIYAHLMDTTYATIRITDIGSAVYHPLDINPGTVIINGVLSPSLWDLTDLIAELKVPLNSFIHSYPLWWDTTQEVFTVEGAFNDGTPFTTEGAFTCIGHISGDANDDGYVNTGDVVYLINYIFNGGPPPHLLAAGDANGDGEVSVGDAVYLVRYLFGNGPRPLHS